MLIPCVIREPVRDRFGKEHMLESTAVINTSHITFAMTVISDGQSCLSVRLIDGKSLTVLRATIDLLLPKSIQ